MHFVSTVSLQTPKPLQQLEVPLISRETCSCLYNINAVPEEPHTIQPDMLCAGYVEGGKDACQVSTRAQEHRRPVRPERCRAEWSCLGDCCQRSVLTELSFSLG